MSEADLNNLIVQLALLHAEFEHVMFPYDDCAAAYEQYGDVLYSIFGNLNTYTMGVFGFQSWGLRFFQWEKERIDRKLDYYSKSFFEQFLQYAVLREPLANGDFLALNFYLESTDKQREIMLVLLKEVQDRHRSSSGQQEP